jgi:class 3 adenylate cyclase
MDRRDPVRIHRRRPGEEQGMDDIAEWLNGLGLSRYVEIFAANDIDFSVIRALTEQDLKDLGFSLGHRRKLLQAVADLDHAGQAAASAAADPAGRRHLTVMFCDLADSTALATQLDPEDMREIILAYQRACTAVIQAHDGFLAKYMGDGILIYFGYPRAREQDGERAVRAGLAILAAIARLTTSSGITPRVRIGIATGPVIVGDLIGEGIAQERAVVGEAPNLAARLQSLALPGTMVIAPSTRRLLGSLFKLRDLGLHQLKGYAEPVAAWAVEGEASVASRFEATRNAGLTDLIGRADQGALLLERKDLAWRGQGQVIQISGEAGIGKSRLAEWLVEGMAPETHATLRYQCSASHTNTPLHPFIQQLRFASGIGPTDPPAQQLEKLEALLATLMPGAANVVPLYASLMSIPTSGRYKPIGVDAAQLRRLTLATLLDQMAALTYRQPVLLLVEDMHWADTASQELVGLAIDRIRELPALMIVTCRPDFESPWQGRSNVTTLVLDRLSEHYSRAMIHRLTGGRDLPPEVIEEILAKTDGVPLFIEELTKSVLESGRLVEVEGSYRLAGSLVELGIPATLQESLMARLDRLAATRAVAQAGATIGRSFSYAMVAAVSGLDDHMVSEALDELVEAELILRRGSGTEANYTFKHALVQDAAYESLLRNNRQALHGRIVEVIETRFTELLEVEAELLARHCTRAQLNEKAVAYWLRAAQRSRQRSYLAETAVQVEAALKLLLAQPESPERDRSELTCQSLVAQALVHARGYGAIETMAAWRRAQSLAAAIGTPDERFSINYGLWVGQYTQGELAAALTLAYDSLRVAEAAGSSAQRCVAERLATAAHFLGGEFTKALDHCTRSAQFYTEVVEPQLANDLARDHLVNTLCYRAMLLWPLGYPDQAREAIGFALSFAKQLNHAPSLVYAYWHAGVMVSLMSGEDTLIADYTNAFVGLAEKHGLSWWQLGGRATLAWLQARAGSGVAASAEVGRYCEILRQERTRVYDTLFFALHGEALAAAGDVAGGLAVLKAGIDYAEASGQAFWLVELYRLQGMIRRQSRDERNDAEQSLRRALAIARQQNAPSWALRAAIPLAGLLAAEGKADDAYRLLNDCYQGFTEGFETRDLRTAQAMIKELASQCAQMVDQS